MDTLLAGTYEACTSIKSSIFPSFRASISFISGNMDRIKTHTHSYTWQQKADHPHDAPASIAPFL